LRRLFLREALRRFWIVSKGGPLLLGILFGVTSTQDLPSLKIVLVGLLVVDLEHQVILNVGELLKQSLQLKNQLL